MGYYSGWKKGKWFLVLLTSSSFSFPGQKSPPEAAFTYAVHQQRAYGKKCTHDNTAYLVLEPLLIIVIIDSVLPVGFGFKISSYSCKLIAQCNFWLECLFFPGPMVVTLSSNHFITMLSRSGMEWLASLQLVFRDMCKNRHMLTQSAVSRRVLTLSRVRHIML